MIPTARNICTLDLCLVRAQSTLRFYPEEYGVFGPKRPPYAKAILFLISAIALAGLSPLGHVREQFKIV